MTASVIMLQSLDKQMEIQKTTYHPSLGRDREPHLEFATFPLGQVLVRPAPSARQMLESSRRSRQKRLVRRQRRSCEYAQWLSWTYIMRERIESSRKLCVAVFERGYAAVHSSGMDINIPVLLTRMMELVPGKQTGLAARLGEGVSQPQVSRWLKGSIPEVPNYERIIAVAEELGILSDVRSEDVADEIDRGPHKTIVVKGYVGAGGQTHIYNVANAGELDTITASDKDTNQTVALRIIGSSLGKFFDRWYVCYDDVRSPITDDLIGQLCVVGLSDDRVLIKKIARHGKTKQFDLLSNAEDEPVIKNVVIEWAAKVNDLRQG